MHMYEQFICPLMKLEVDYSVKGWPNSTILGLLELLELLKLLELLELLGIVGTGKFGITTFGWLLMFLLPGGVGNLAGGKTELLGSLLEYESVGEMGGTEKGSCCWL